METKEQVFCKKNNRESTLIESPVCWSGDTLTICNSCGMTVWDRGFKELHSELKHEEGQVMNNRPTQQKFSESDVREMICERDKEWFQIIESIFNFHPVSMTEALKIGIDRMKNKNELIRRLNDHIETLEECGNSLFNGLTRDEAMKRWEKAKEAKL
jgi:uncharacterized protein YbaR (Trm112 family)